MSSNVVRIAERTATRVEDYLGPASVTQVAGSSVEVQIPDGPVVPAQLALAFPYQPVTGDSLLVIARGPQVYVIGVLHGAGASVFSLPGDVGLHAGGAMHLSAQRGLTLSGAEVEVHAGKLRMLADSVVQTFASMFQRVSEQLSIHAGESHTLVDGGAYQQSKSATILTQETVTINGDQINLG